MGNTVKVSLSALRVPGSKDSNSRSAPQIFLFDTFKVGPRASSGSPKVFVSVPRSWRSDRYKIFGPKTAIFKQTLRCCYSKSECSTELTLGDPSFFGLNLTFEKKKKFCSDKFYLVKLRSPLDFFAPSKVTLPPTLLSLWIGINPPLAIIKKIKKIWNGICPGFWINWTNPFWRWLVTLY